MALTLEAEQRMEDVGIIAFYEDEAAEWLATCKATKAFVTGNFPHGFADSQRRRSEGSYSNS